MRPGRYVPRGSGNLYETRKVCICHGLREPLRPGRYVCVTACRNLYETWSVCTTGLRELAQTARTFGIVVDSNCGNGGRFPASCCRSRETRQSTCSADRMYQLGWERMERVGGGISVGRHVFPAVGAGNLRSLFGTGRERPGRRSRPARAPPTGADCSNGDKPFPWLTDWLCRRAAIAMAHNTCRVTCSFRVQ